MRVTRARENEAPACLALLPEILGAPAEFLIARSNGAFAGAAAVLWANWAEPAGFRVHLRVLKSARGHGVGRQLVAAAAELADGETDGLWSLQAAPPESLEAKFLQACGFAPRKREHYFQIGVTRMLDHIGPIAQRYREHGHVPDGAEILFLSEVDGSLEEVAWLIAREFDNSPFVNLQTLSRRRADGVDRSLIARIDGDLAGVMLWRVEAGVAILEVRVVAQRWRSGWANLMMMEKGLLFAQSQGLQQAKFFCDETLNDTIKLAKRGEGQETDIKARYYLPFG